MKEEHNAVYFSTIYFPAIIWIHFEGKTEPEALQTSHNIS